MSLLAIPAFAITESEVEAQVASSGKEAVAGNVFIWFLCALAFLKVSQKIDSILQSLGINAGRTGGSLLAEVMIATRAVSMLTGIGGRGYSGAGRAASGASGAAASGTSGLRGYFKGGLAGMASRRATNNAIKTATGASSGFGTSGSQVKGGGGAASISPTSAGTAVSTGSTPDDTPSPIAGMTPGATESGSIPTSGSPVSSGKSPGRAVPRETPAVRSAAVDIPPVSSAPGKTVLGGSMPADTPLNGTLGGEAINGAEFAGHAPGDIVTNEQGDTMSIHETCANHAQGKAPVDPASKGETLHVPHEPTPIRAGQQGADSENAQTGAMQTASQSTVSRESASAQQSTETQFAESAAAKAPNPTPTTASLTDGKTTMPLGTRPVGMDTDRKTAESSTTQKTPISGSVSGNGKTHDIPLASSKGTAVRSTPQKGSKAEPAQSHVQHTTQTVSLPSQEAHAHTGPGVGTENREMGTQSAPVSDGAAPISLTAPNEPVPMVFSTSGGGTIPYVGQPDGTAATTEGHFAIEEPSVPTTGNGAASNHPGQAVSQAGQQDATQAGEDGETKRNVSQNAHTSIHKSTHSSTRTTQQHKSANTVHRPSHSSTNSFWSGSGQKVYGIGGRMFMKSLASGGDFANEVIGRVARGDIQSTGTITSEMATQALNSYMAAGPAPGDNSPQRIYSQVEIGGGRISGFERPADTHQDVQFCMYDASQYAAPEGEHTKVVTADGAVWYKQYEEDAVQRKPYMAPDGAVAYEESIVKRMPHAPQRKNRM